MSSASWQQIFGSICILIQRCQQEAALAALRELQGQSFSAVSPGPVSSFSCSFPLARLHQCLTSHAPCFEFGLDQADTCLQNWIEIVGGWVGGAPCSIFCAKE